MKRIHGTTDIPAVAYMRMGTLASAKIKGAGLTLLANTTVSLT
jgi:hypothetical protein